VPPEAAERARREASGRLPARAVRRIRGHSGSNCSKLPVLPVHGAAGTTGVPSVPMRPGRFELPRPVKVTRPSTLGLASSLYPLALDPNIWSARLDDLDLVDGAFVVTVLSGRGLLCSPTAAADDQRAS
jgi:hypothetical protein